MSQRESKLEDKLVDACKLHNVLCYKLHKANKRGWPDRTLFKNGKILFVEIKTPNGTGELSAPQRLTKLTLQQQGFEFFVLDKFEDVEPLIKKFING